MEERKRGDVLYSLLCRHPSKRLPRLSGLTPPKINARDANALKGIPKVDGMKLLMLSPGLAYIERFTQAKRGKVPESK